VGVAFDVVADGGCWRRGGRRRRVGGAVGELAFLGGVFQAFYSQGLGGGCWWWRSRSSGERVRKHGLDGRGFA